MFILIYKDEGSGVVWIFNFGSVLKYVCFFLIWFLEGTGDVLLSGVSLCGEVIR